MTEPVKIAVVLDGGNVQAVLTAGAPVEYVVIDYDVECVTDTYRLRKVAQPEGAAQLAFVSPAAGAEPEGPFVLAAFDLAAQPDEEQDSVDAPPSVDLEALHVYSDDDLRERVDHLAQLERPGPVDLGADDNWLDQDTLFHELRICREELRRRANVLQGCRAGRGRFSMRAKRATDGAATAGAEDYAAGKPLSANPYVTWTEGGGLHMGELAARWQSGWNRAAGRNPNTPMTADEAATATAAAKAEREQYEACRDPGAKSRTLTRRERRKRQRVAGGE